MGLFDIFKGKKQELESPVEEITHEVGIEGMTNWLSEHFGSQTESANKRARSIGSDALESMSSARDKLLRLEKSSFGGKDKIYAAANMAKNSFVKRSISIIEGSRLSFVDKETYRGLTGFNNKLKDALAEINRISPKQLFLLSKFFKNESKDVMAKIKLLEDKTKELDSFLDSDGKIMNMTEKVGFDVKRLNKLIEKLSVLHNQEKEIESGISMLEKKKKEHQSGLESIMAGREWKELASIEQSIEKSKSQLSSIESDANEVLGSAKRPLKKLKHLLESRESFPDNPFKSIVLAGREGWLTGQLESTKEHYNEGKILLKPKEAERVNEIIEWVATKLPGLKAKYNDLQAGVNETERNAEKFDIRERKSGIQKQLDESEVSIKKRWAELNSKIQDVKTTESEINAVRENAEKLVLDIGGKKLKIKISKEKPES